MQNFTSFSGEENKNKNKNPSSQLHKDSGKGAEGTTAPTNQVGPRRRGSVLLRKTREVSSDTAVDKLWNKLNILRS